MPFTAVLHWGRGSKPQARIHPKSHISYPKSQIAQAQRPHHGTNARQNLSPLSVRRQFLALLPLAAILLTGCMTEEQQMVGKWRGKVEMSAAMKSSPYGNMASQYINMIQPQLDLRPDKTFVLSFSMAPIEGTWALKNQDIILTPKSVMGMSAGKARQEADKAMNHAPGFQMPMGMNLIPDDKQLTVHVLNHGQELTLDPAAGTIAGGLGQMSFTKV
jgi:hypothetical protein